MKKQAAAYRYAIASVIFWSTVATAFKIALKEVDFLQLLLYSSFFSLLALAIISVFTKKINIIFQTSWKEILSSAFLGFLNPFLYYVV